MRRLYPRVCGRGVVGGMMMTEDKAKTKWCPFARTLDWDSATVRQGDEPITVFASVNRVPGDYDRNGNETVELSGRHRCIASACMAWRSQISDATNQPTGRGFCGLAGIRGLVE